MPMRKIWNSYFCKSACVEWANSHFFEEPGCQHCMPGRFWIWFVSLGHPVLLHQQQRWNTSASTTITLGGGQKKQCVSAFRPGYHCANTIHYSYSDFTCNWSAVFMLNNDMFILPSQSCVCVLPLKSPCISVGLCVCVTSKLIEELISMRWKTDVDKSTLQLCILVEKTK